MTATDKQVCTFRELVLAHHAYERALAEFAAQINVTKSSIHRQGIANICQELSPRSVTRADAEFAINCIKDF